MQKHNAFTLIELSIVLVIIGLIVGAVLVGQDLIKAAEIRAQISQIEKTNTAVLTFKLKYNALPGDIANATQFFGSSTQPEKVTNGNGNGMILGYIYQNTGNYYTPHSGGGWVAINDNASEQVSFWDHLAASGFTSHPQYDEKLTNITLHQLAYPRLAIQSKGQDQSLVDAYSQTYTQGGLMIGYAPAFNYVHAGHKLWLGECNSAPGGGYQQVSLYCGLNPEEARRLDEKMDDGKPYSGSIYLIGQQGTFRVPNSASIGGYDSTNLCRNSGANRYLMESEIPTHTDGSTRWRGCGVSIDAAF